MYLCCRSHQVNTGASRTKYDPANDKRAAAVSVPNIQAVSTAVGGVKVSLSNFISAIPSVANELKSGLLRTIPQMAG